MKYPTSEIPNTLKCEIVGIGGLKWANVALCGMQYINLDKKCLKILGIHFSYNKNKKKFLNVI